MATDMVIGYIYFVESNAVDNIDWVPTVDNIVLGALYTEGTEYCKLQIPEEIVIDAFTSIEATHTGGGTGFQTRPNARFYEALSKGIETSRSNAATVRNFFMLDRHTSGAAATYRQVYLVVKYSAAGYEKFVDHDSTSRDFCKGVVPHVKTVWRKDDYDRAMVFIDWISTWGG